MKPATLDALGPWPPLPTTATPGRFLEKQPKLHPESLSDMPERNHRRIALPQFEAADVGTIYAHPLGQLGLRQPGRNSQPPHIPPHHAPHVFRHGPNRKPTCQMFKKLTARIFAVSGTSARAICSRGSATPKASSGPGPDSCMRR